MPASSPPPVGIHGENSLRERSQDFAVECIGFFTDLAQVLGVPRSLGQIYGLLFASSEPLSFKDIVDRLGISKGSASEGLQWLRSLGAVRSIEGKDARRELFAPELGLRTLIGGVLREKVNPLLNDGGTRMEHLRGYARGVLAAGGTNFPLKRVQQLETWHRQLSLLLPLLKTFLRSGQA